MMPDGWCEWEKRKLALVWSGTFVWSCHLAATWSCVVGYFNAGRMMTITMTMLNPDGCRWLKRKLILTSHVQGQCQLAAVVVVVLTSGGCRPRCQCEQSATMTMMTMAMVMAMGRSRLPLLRLVPATVLVMKMMEAVMLMVMTEAQWRPACGT